MKQNKPYIVPVNQQTCYVTPEIMKQFDDELDEEVWMNFLTFEERLIKKTKGHHA